MLIRPLTDKPGAFYIWFLNDSCRIFKFDIVRI